MRSLPGRDRVRVRGADAPEIKAHRAAEKRLALAAEQFTTSRLVGRIVLLENVQGGQTSEAVGWQFSRTVQIRFHRTIA